MPEAYKKLAQLQLGTDIVTDPAVYTVPAATQTIAKHMRAVNTGAAASTFTIYHDGSASSNCILPPVELAVGEWAEFDGTLLMETADTLKAAASVATTITFSLYGLELS